eukprot:CAMPEP_0175039320 /NCGR_PEP_ID=MMETSP0052_2-20121109/496_1 /TAXON_ID=51329 ORGANISM="Polytomella parva, Strain SAG 63-3" /NCGR_SAMPLE_ID=MMETSP0052_2 /ASSEMBLY_ACC=CAM_ASM_000194 /LENGTH=181 /DNA_ID=CAMNT_0016301115 /DNA_START=168 /DNA_END=710 /DNA_ORIENTATION=+
MSSRLLKELKSLSPWQWDSKVIKHPPGAASLRDFEKVDAAFLTDNKQTSTRLHETSKDLSTDYIFPSNNRRKSLVNSDNFKDPDVFSSSNKASSQDVPRKGGSAALMSSKKKRRRLSSPDRLSRGLDVADVDVEMAAADSSPYPAHSTDPTDLRAPVSSKASGVSSSFSGSIGGGARTDDL